MTQTPSPRIANADLSARNVVGESVRPRPAASSRVLTPSIVVLGCSFSVHFASLSPAGTSTRFLNGCCARPREGLKAP